MTPGDLIRDPARAADVPLDQVPALLAQLAAVQVALLARLVANGNGHGDMPKAPAEPDRLLTADEAGAIMGVSPRWLHRRAKALPFARRLSRKALRFSEAGLRRYLTARRP